MRVPRPRAVQADDEVERRPAHQAEGAGALQRDRGAAVRRAPGRTPLLPPPLARRPVHLTARPPACMPACAAPPSPLLPLCSRSPFASSSSRCLTGACSAASGTWTRTSQTWRGESGARAGSPGWARAPCPGGAGRAPARPPPLAPPPAPSSPETGRRHVGGGGNAVDVDYGSMLFEVSQLDINLDIT